MAEELSFIENINKIAKKLDIIVESNQIFDDGVIPVLHDIAELDLYEAIQDLRKGNYLGNRKIDINLALNMQGITQDLIDNDPDAAELIWTNSAQTILYDKAFVTFVDGVVLEVPFIFDANPTTVSTHGDLLIQLNNNAAFLAKLDTTLIAGFASPVVGEMVRIYDVIGQNSNIERIQLHAVSGNYVEESPQYYWAKTTSAFQTLSMRAGDIIKLGNEIDNLILLANSIEQVLALQSRIPELVDTYTNDVANGDVTLYNKLTELLAIHTELTGLIAIYDDIKVGGTNYINSVGADLNGANTIGAVASDINLGINSNIKLVGSNIDNVNKVGADIINVNKVGADIINVNLVAQEVVPHLEEILQADENAAIATEKALQASNSATSAAQSAQTATTKSDEIKNVSVDSTVTATAGTPASVVYNPTIGKFTFVVPQGSKGDRGEAFAVNAVGLLADRALYDTRLKGFSFLALDQSAIYFKLSDTSEDWSVAAPFGKGDKGDTGDTGRGIVSIQPTSTTNPDNTYGVGGFTDTYTISYSNSTTSTFNVYNGRGISSIDFASTTDISGLAAQSGATDTYEITFTDGTTSSYVVYNGADSAVLSVAGKTGDIVLTEADITDLDKYTKAQVDAIADALDFNYISKSANYTAVANDFIYADTSVASFTITLPANPTANDVVAILDNTSSFATNHLSVARNGKNIMGLAEDYHLDIDTTSIEFIYNGTEWRIKQISPSSSGNELTPTPTLNTHTLSINEYAAPVTFTITNYDSINPASYTIAATLGTIVYTTGNTFTYEPPVVTADTADTISIYAVGEGQLRSDTVTVAVTINNLGVVDGQSIIVTNFTGEFETNDLWEVI